MCLCYVPYFHANLKFRRFVLPNSPWSFSFFLPLQQRVLMAILVYRPPGGRQGDMAATLYLGHHVNYFLSFFFFTQNVFTLRWTSGLVCQPQLGGRDQPSRSVSLGLYAISSVDKKKQPENGEADLKGVKKLHSKYFEF